MAKILISIDFNKMTCKNCTLLHPNYSYPFCLAFKAHLGYNRKSNVIRCKECLDAEKAVERFEAIASAASDFEVSL